MRRPGRRASAPGCWRRSTRRRCRCSGASRRRSSAASASSSRSSSRSSGHSRSPGRTSSPSTARPASERPGSRSSAWSGSLPRSGRRSAVAVPAARDAPYAPLGELLEGLADDELDNWVARRLDPPLAAWLTGAVGWDRRGGAPRGDGLGGAPSPGRARAADAAPRLARRRALGGGRVPRPRRVARRARRRAGPRALPRAARPARRAAALGRRQAEQLVRPARRADRDRLRRAARPAVRRRGRRARGARAHPGRRGREPALHRAAPRGRARRGGRCRSRLDPDAPRGAARPPRRA